jgi:hypothetical protein
VRACFLTGKTSACVAQDYFAVLMLVWLLFRWISYGSTVMFDLVRRSDAITQTPSLSPLDEP